MKKTKIGFLMIFSGFILIVIGVLSETLLISKNLLSVESSELQSVNSITWIIIITGIALAVIGVIIVIIAPSSTVNSAQTKNGVQVVGRIVSVSQTNMMVNYQPQLKITVEFNTTDGRTIIGSEYKVLQQLNIMAVAQGRFVPVRYDPNDPQKMMIDFEAMMQ